MRGFGGRGPAWWYNSGGGWDSWDRGDSQDKGGIGVLSLGRASSNHIILVNE